MIDPFATVQFAVVPAAAVRPAPAPATNHRQRHPVRRPGGVVHGLHRPELVASAGVAQLNLQLLRRVLTGLRRL